MGNGYWSQSGCNLNGHTRPDIWWYGYPGTGAFYWKPGDPNPGPYFVGGPIHANFAAGGYECGGCGRPIGPEYKCAGGQPPNPPLPPFNYSFQIFEGGRFVTNIDWHSASYQAGDWSYPCTIAYEMWK